MRITTKQPVGTEMFVLVDEVETDKVLATYSTAREAYAAANEMNCIPNVFPVTVCADGRLKLAY